MGRRLRVALRTQGCKVNLFDQWEIEDGLRKVTRPADLVPWSEPADVYVINTCTVTGAADRQNRQLIYQVSRREPGASVVVTGCMAQVAPDHTASLAGVTHVVGNDDKAGLPELLASLPLRSDILPRPAPAAGAAQVAGTSGAAQVAGTSGARISSAGRTRPYLKVQDGCDTGCTYCILPRARGRSRSMGVEEVLERLHRWGEAGIAEVVVTGLNMGDYGHDLEPRTNLAALLRRIEDEAPVSRIRLSSIEPRGVTPELLELLASSRRICRHLHLPLQAGDDGILKAMHRPYRRRWFIELAERLLEAMPELCLGTDVICGFPGEGAAEFERTMEICEQIPFAYFHAFPYSPREGTPAAASRDDVSPQGKKARVARIRRLSESRRADFAARHVGTVQEVVLEGDPPPAAQVAGTPLRRGLTRSYVRVELDAGQALAGRAVDVRVERSEGATCHGRLEIRP